MLSVNKAPPAKPQRCPEGSEAKPSARWGQRAACAAIAAASVALSCGALATEGAAPKGDM